MIKLFATDLDGTLLNAFHKVDHTIHRAVRTATDAGAHVVVATGRTFRSASDFGFAGTGIDAAGCNGSLILNREGEVIYHGVIDPAFLETMIRAFPQICFECVGVRNTYATGSFEERQAGFRTDRPLQRIAMVGMRRRRKLMSTDTLFSQPLSTILGHDICKVNARTADEALGRELTAFLADHQDTVVNTPFQPVMFEITDKADNKGAAVARLAAYYGIDEDEVAVYGDGGNDLVMLDRFEHSFATSNASDAAKQAAGTVIGNCAFHAVPKHMLKTLRDQAATQRYTTI